MAGTIDLVQRVSTGIEEKADVLRLNPEMAPELESLFMRIRYRGHSLDLLLTRDTMTIQGRGPEAPSISLQINDKSYEFVSVATCVFQLNGKHC